jgi:UPF0755 protein
VRARAPRLLLLAILIAGAASLWTWIGSGPAVAPTDVVVERGASVASIARSLKRARVVRSATLFHIGARLLGSGHKIKAGEYEIPAGASPARILAILDSGKTLQRLVTVPEGLPSVLVQERLGAAPALIGEAPLPEEGSVLPDSYSYVRGEQRSAVLARMQAAMTKALATLWPKRKAGLPVQSPEEAVILASIVEKETAKPSERPMIAAVYENRLRQGMPLQADPTVIYPVTRGRPLGRRILQSELHTDNGYNTYARRGLPQGPIANPGRQSLAAVLNPAESAALYFVADGTGGHVFANTLAEHNANVQKWYALRRSRGEM